MAPTPRKKPRNKTWDREHDLHIHLQNNNYNNNNFNTLLHKFVINNPKSDPELMQFTDGSSNILQSHALHLQDQNRDNNNNTDEENNTEDEEEYNKYLLEHFKPCGKSHVLEIIDDGVYVTYEDETSYSRKCGSKGKKKKGEIFSASEVNIETNNVASKVDENGGKRKRGRPRKNVVSMDENGKKGEETDTPSYKVVTVKEENIEKIEKCDYEGEVEELLPVDDEVNARKREFRENLMNELNKPYCEKKHKKLLKVIKRRKLVQNHKDLRGGIKTYEEDHEGKSYLDHNLDLAKKIEAAGDDHPQVLRLLRGFFFWLRNISHEGKFMPWRDPSCLNVLPQQ